MGSMWIQNKKDMQWFKIEKLLQKCDSRFVFLTISLFHTKDDFIYPIIITEMKIKLLHMGDFS